MRLALVIEDEPDIAGFVVAAFKRFGFDAFVVESVADAVEFLEQSNGVAAIFVHLNKESEQRELVTTVAARWPATTIILLSSRLESLRDLPPSIFLAKPTAAATIMAVIRRLAIESGEGVSGSIN